MTPGARIRRFLRGFGPAMAPPHSLEPLRAALGGLMGLGLCGAFLFSPFVDKATGLFLIAPLGASAVLLFAVPNSPLAQPWSAVVGNTISGVVAWAVLLVVPDTVLAPALCVGGAILAMSLVRALHPPGGAVALLSALNAPLVHTMGLRFALVAAGGGTLSLVILAIVWNRLTGRVYPFRQPTVAGTHGTADLPPERRLSLTSAELSHILSDFRQDTNLGPEDLARLIEAAETAAAAHHFGTLTCADIMSRDLVTVVPDTRLTEVAELFRKHGFTSIPVIGPQDRFIGIIFQIDIIRRAREDALRQRSTLISALNRLADQARKTATTAAEIMSVAVPRVGPGAPLGQLLPLLADGGTEAVPVLEGTRLVGIVTRSDLVSALSHGSFGR
ncbi:CBS domain-containing protein [bacterium]|nr:CBS domain-containing protein [bacterium]